MSDDPLTAGEDFVLHGSQMKIEEVPPEVRFTVLGGGRRSGKTFYARFKIRWAVVDDPGAYAYIVPTYSDIIIVRDNLLSKMGSIITRDNRQERTLEFIGGAKLYFFSSDAIDRARGYGFKGIILDEAASMPNLEYAWTRVLMPTLTDHSGWALFVSSFRGRNYFWQLYQQALDPLNIDWAAFSFRTIDNPFLKDGAHEVEIARRTLPEKAFLEEYEAIPSEDYGTVFRRVTAVAIGLPRGPVDGERYVFGVDWGKINDYTVIVVFDKVSREMVHIERFNQIDYVLQTERLGVLAAQYKPTAILAEANSMGEVVIDLLQRQGLMVERFLMTGSSKPALIDQLSVSIEKEDLKLLNDPILISELQSYEVKRSSSGAFQYNAPPGFHDDTVIATALAVHAATISRIQAWVY